MLINFINLLIKCPKFIQNKIRRSSNDQAVKLGKITRKHVTIDKQIQQKTAQYYTCTAVG